MRRILGEAAWARRKKEEGHPAPASERQKRTRKNEIKYLEKKTLGNSEENILEVPLWTTHILGLVRTDDCQLGSPDFTFRFWVSQTLVMESLSLQTSPDAWESLSR